MTRNARRGGARREAGHRGMLWLVVAGLLMSLLGGQRVVALQTVHITRGTSATEVARFSVDIADEPAEWRRGLMYRTALPPGNGMLFIFPDAAPRAFWMLHTLIALDILFIDAQGRILNIAENVPPCLPPRRCPTYHSAGPAKYVLEIAGGRARALGITVGDTLHLE